MTKAVLSIGFALALFFVAQSAQNSLSHFKTIEAYEVRPGILMLPRHTADGQICEIGLEKLHHSGGEINLAPNLTRAEIDEIADQLVPSNERGPKGQRGVSFMGNSAVTDEEYQNISIQAYGAVVGAPIKDRTSLSDISVSVTAATIKWKHRTCGQQTGTETGH